MDHSKAPPGARQPWSLSNQRSRAGSGVGRPALLLLDDVLEAAAGDLRHAVGIRTQNEGGSTHPPRLLAWGLPSFPAASLPAFFPYLGLADMLHEADALNVPPISPSRRCRRGRSRVLTFTHLGSDIDRRNSRGG